MPISLPPLSRRQFLAGSVSSAAAMLLGGLSASGQTSPSADPDRIALLSDIHIRADRTVMQGASNMADHLQQACAEILRLDARPSAALICGDCAHLTGESADYATLIDLLDPLRKAGMPVHLAMGNHDRRDHFWKALPADDARVADLAQREVLVVQSPRVDWFILDSLETTNATPGSLGEAQLRWLAKALDEKSDKPAIVMVHHTPKPARLLAAPPSTAPGVPQRWGGLLESKELYDVLLPRKRVKALLYGHSHVWKVEQMEGLHMINLPAVAYVFSPKQPLAWVDAVLSDKAMTLELRCLNPNDPLHGEKHNLEWRT